MPPNPSAVFKERSLGLLLRRLWHHLGAARRCSFVVLLVLMILGAIAEIMSIGAVVPFIGILTAPEQVLQYPAVASLARQLELETPEQLILPLTLIFILAVTVAAAIRLLVIWLSTRLTYVTGADISLDVYRRTLYQPYRVHVGRSSSEMISNITGKVGQTMLGILLPMLTLISSIVLLCAIVGTLVYINPMVAIVAALSFGVCYGLITIITRRRLQRNSRYIANEMTQVVKSLQEGLGGIRDVLLHGTQPVYCKIYRESDLRWRVAQGENVFIAQSPRFLMEAIGMILIALFAYWVSGQPGGLVNSLPLLAALALGSQRMLPTLQQTYASIASITGSKISFSDTIEMLDQPLPSDLLQPPPNALPFERELVLDQLSFSYYPEQPQVLKQLSLSIRKGERVGIVGSTGSGKSTLVDLVMGLLDPTGGHIRVDETNLTHGNVRAWQQSIAHVPQNIFLSDASLAENIAFGVHPDDINMQQVRRAADEAQVSEFVGDDPNGFNVIVGERGVRLSGGQRQRIGIARALYRRASVLILDEATSALDNETEQSVMRAMDRLDRDLTVLIIAHRLTTVRDCDLIVQLEKGEIVARGSYDELIQTSQRFRQIANAAQLP